MDQNNSLEQSIRKIVREELANIFSQGNLDFDSGDTTTQQPKRRGRKPGSTVHNKGAVTNPSTDRRLKANREANA